MNNIVVLQKDEDGNIFCQQITAEGAKYMLEHKDDEDAELYWELGGTILLEELEGILDKQINLE